MSSRVLLATVVCAVTVTHAQLRQRCEWHYPQNSDTVTHERTGGYGETQYFTSIINYADPVSFDSLDGMVFDVPENVTRIKRTALTFKDETTQGGGADLIFMIDGSGSMWWGSENVAVITYEGDTLYRIQGGEQSGFPVGTATKMVQGEPREFHIYCCSDRNDLYRVPGDPFYESWGMMKETILLERDLVTNAYAGFMPFAGQYKRDNDPGSGNHDYYTPLANISRGHPDAITNLMALWYLGRNDYDGRTLPGPALPTAKARRAQWTAIQWGLDDAMAELESMGRTDNRAVIVFSDGEVHDLAADQITDEKIASYPYPVYSISLIEPRYDSNFTMTRLTEGTGGHHWTVKPGDQDSLANIMQSILGEVTKVKIPIEVELVNNSLSPVMTSYAANWGLEKTPDGEGWAIELDSVLALAEGTNQLTFTVTFKDGETGQLETKSSSFTINVGGGTYDEEFVTCYDAATMSLRTETGRTTRISPEDDHGFTITLKNSAFDLVGRNNPVYAYTSVLGDTLWMQLDDTVTKDFSEFPYETFSDDYGYSGAATSAKVDDRTLQSAEEDTVVFRWEHPRDPRDTATLIVPTDDGSLIPPTADPEPGKYVQASLSVTLIDQNPGLDPSLRYSINGGGFQNFAGSIELEGSSGLDTFTIRAFATAPDYINSDTVTFTYIIEIPKLLPPTASPAGGTYEQATLSVTLGEPNAGANVQILYSVDGKPFQPYSLPVQLDAGDTGATHTLRAYVAAQGYLNSDTVSFSYTLTLPRLEPPVADPDGGAYKGTQQVSLSHPQAGVTIRYTLDGTDPRTSSTAQVYAEPFTLRAAGSTTLKAVARKDGYLASAVYEATFTNQDSEGPYVTTAKYFLGNLPGASGETRPDTLVVGFNEPVRCTEITTGTPATILRFVDGDGSAQSGTIFDGATIEGSCGGTTKSLRIVLPTPGLISPIDDSLAAVEGVLYDPYNNATPAKRAVVIEWGKAYEAIPIAKNIFSPLEEIPPVILGSLTSGSQAPPKTGTMIEILSVRPIVTEKSHAAVYDAVGNVVRTGLPVYEVKGDRSRYWQFWDGKNTAGRMVGTGTYLTVITLQLNDGTTSQTKLKLGVKR